MWGIIGKGGMYDKEKLPCVLCETTRLQCTKIFHLVELKTGESLKDFSVRNDMYCEDVLALSAQNHPSYIHYDGHRFHKLGVPEAQPKRTLVLSKRNPKSGLGKRALSVQEKNGAVIADRFVDFQISWDECMIVPEEGALLWVVGVAADFGKRMCPIYEDWDIVPEVFARCTLHLRLRQVLCFVCAVVNSVFALVAHSPTPHLDVFSMYRLMGKLLDVIWNAIMKSNMGKPKKTELCEKLTLNHQGYVQFHSEKSTKLQNDVRDNGPSVAGKGTQIAIDQLPETMRLAYREIDGLCVRHSCIKLSCAWCQDRQDKTKRMIELGEHIKILLTNLDRGDWSQFTEADRADLQAKVPMDLKRLGLRLTNAFRSEDTHLLGMNYMHDALYHMGDLWRYWLKRGYPLGSISQGVLELHHYHVGRKGYTNGQLAGKAGRKRVEITDEGERKKMPSRNPFQEYGSEFHVYTNMAVRSCAEHLCKRCGDVKYNCGSRGCEEPGLKDLTEGFRWSPQAQKNIFGSQSQSCVYGKATPKAKLTEGAPAHSHGLMPPNVLWPTTAGLARFQADSQQIQADSEDSMVIDSTSASEGVNGEDGLNQAATGSPVLAEEEGGSNSRHLEGSFLPAGSLLGLEHDDDLDNVSSEYEVFRNNALDSQEDNLERDAEDDTELQAETDKTNPSPSCQNLLRPSRKRSATPPLHQQ